MTDTRTLDGRTAIVYGGAGAIGSAVAHAFSREGAKVHLGGRTPESLEKTAAEVRAAGGRAETAVVDALDEEAVESHADRIMETDGRLDISINLIGHADGTAAPLTEISLEDFESPVRTRVRSSFLTARAAARRMVDHGSGVIIFFGGYGSPMANLGGMQVSFGAVESLRRDLAVELGPHGVRVVTIQTAGVADTIPDSVSEDLRRTLTGAIEERSIMGRSALREDIGEVAAFAASDRARAMTATVFNVTAGAEYD